MLPLDPAAPTPIERAAAAIQDAPVPTIGRIVLYAPTPMERVGRGLADYYPAIITRVWSPRCVNLHVLADGGPAFFVTSVDFSLVPTERSWRWPPRA